MSSLSWRIRHRLKQWKMKVKREPFTVPVPVIEPGPLLPVPTSNRKIVCGLHGALMEWSYPRPVSPEANLDMLWSMIDEHQQHATVFWRDEPL